jgi:hypothetical protein
LKLNINRQLDNEPVYVGTERLDVYCEKLKSIELPTQMWGYEK